MMDPYRKLTQGRLEAGNRAPYFRQLLLSMVPVETPGLGTTAITNSLLFLWDPAAIDSWESSTITYAWWHEAMHVMLKHHGRRGNRDPYVWNLAGDVFINHSGVEAGFILPKWAILPGWLELPHTLTTDEYYDHIMKDQKGLEKALKSRKSFFPSPPLSSEGHKAMSGPDGRKGKGSQGEGQPKDFACGSCGSGSGNQNSSEPDEETAKAEGARSKSDIDLTIRGTAENIQKASKSQGRVPRGLARWVDSLFTPPKVPWQQLLARSIRAAIKYRPGAIDYRYSRPSRRQAAIGYGAGRPVLPGLVSPLPRVAVVLDTSGSMGSAEVLAGLSEAAGVIKAVGAEIEFCACDAAVHSLQKVRSPKALAALVKGGGGTDFVPAFDALCNQRRAPEVIIFITDGYGRAPENPPPARTIWLITPNGTKPCNWGEFIDLEIGN